MAKIFVSFTIVSTSNFFLVARESGTPLAEVYRSPLLTSPHSQRNITIDPVNPVMHRVELWTTLDGINLDQLRGRCDIDASQYTQVAFNSKYFIVDRGFPLDPVAGTNQYDDVSLAGLQYTVFMPGFGPLIEGVHIERNTDPITHLDIGGFHFINGQVFLSGAEYTIMISNLTTQRITSSSAGGYPNDIISVIGDINYGTPHNNNLLEVISQNNNNIHVNILDLNTIPENTKFGINTHNFDYNHGYRYTILNLPSGTFTLINGVQENTVYIGRGEAVSFMKKGSYLRIIDDWEGPRLVGKRVYGDDVRPYNGLPLNGGWYEIAQYPRLFYWYVNRLTPAELGTGYTDDQVPDTFTRLRWIIGNLKFWVPDHSGYFYRNANFARPVSTYEAQSLQPANIRTAAYTGSGIGKSSLSQDDIGFLATQGDGGLVRSDMTSGTNRSTARTATWPLITDSAETRPTNVSHIPYVLY